MAKGNGSSLIAALRSNADYSGPRAGGGPSAISTTWGDGAGVSFRRRNSGGALNPSRLGATPGIGYNARRGIGGDSSNMDGSTGGLPVPTTITPFPKKEPIVAPEPQMYEPDLSSIAFVLPEVSFKPEPERDVEISYEELVDASPWNVQAPVADAVKPEPKVAISYEELVDPNPWNVSAPPAELVQEPEVAVTVEEIPDVEPSTLRETLAELLDQATPAEMAEPEGVVTVEEVPDAPIVSDGRPSGGGYAINTGLSRELMMLAALADMFSEPEGQITIEELDDFR